ncbi:hypothetical protein BsWGS_18712 [Bradybaena similaris]
MPNNEMELKTLIHSRIHWCEQRDCVSSRRDASDCLRTKAVNVN